MTRALATAGVLALAALAASAQPPAAVPIDPAIDACAKCKMSVKDSGFSAELIAADGKVYKFDDLGCLLAFEQDEPAVKAAARYVQDEGTKAWTILESAYFVLAKERATPMGYGIHAFAKKEDAAKFASALEDKPKVLKLSELPSYSGSNGMSMP
jgi:copper chaperone NosL